MFISIIVPAFNVELYIKRCIESICHQDISPEMYEVIIINDGSTDDTLLEIKSQISKYETLNIKLIDKPNGGLSSARNAGLQSASGEYVWFVDSDDYIAHNCLSSIFRDINSHKQLDVLAFNMEYVYADGHSSRNDRRLDENKYLSGNELYFKDFRYPYSGVQFSIYRRSYLNSIELQFKEGILFEDILYTTLLLASNPKCVFVDKIYYHYYIRPESITNSKSSVKKCLDCLVIADELYKHIKIKEYYNVSVLYNQIARLMPLIYRYHMRGLSFKGKLVVVKEIIKRDYWGQSIISGEKYKYMPYLVLNYALYPFVSFLEKFNKIEK